MKFAKLNALSAREIAHVVISRKCGKRTAILAKPNVDLRDFSVFDMDAMAELFHTNLSQVQSAFLFADFPNSSNRSSENLRWCTMCAALGFHTPIFQMNVLRHCPVHEIALQSRCDGCKRVIPYRLQLDVAKAPFCCPGCGFDLAPGIRMDQEKVLMLRVTELLRLNQAMDFLKFEEMSLPVKLDINRKRLQLGQGELIAAPLEQCGYFSRYIGFISYVIRDLGYLAAELQNPLPMERVERVSYGDFDSATFDSDNGEVNRLFSPGKLRSRVPENWDQELQAVVTVYRAIRRHIWRHVVKKHQYCIASSSNHLWWDMEGERTKAFCPVAEAFIRWRMLWEGCSTPRYLYSKHKKEPFGLIGWLSARPSPCPAHWSYATRLWVTKHIFANACLESFRERLMIAQKNVQRGEIFWNKDKSAVRYDSYWAVTGSDCKASPAVVYVRCPMEETPPFVLQRGLGGHRDDHLTQLSDIRR
ncbi:hypothetical protein [Undibacterium sp. TJN19]|uniref:hypothetical protein n=1 Tax=Undibacterium sp. TJN19 TaxID=3413055 RepID=UPI003BF1DDAD